MTRQSAHPSARQQLESHNCHLRNSAGHNDHRCGYEYLHCQVRKAESRSCRKRWYDSRRIDQLSPYSQGVQYTRSLRGTVRHSERIGTQDWHKERYVLRIGNGSASASTPSKKTANNTHSTAIFFFVIFSGYALTFYWGTTLLLDGSATSGQIITCFFSVLIGAFSLSMMAPNTAAIAGASGAAEKVLKTVWREPPIDSSSDVGLKPSSVEGAFTLENVTFYYPSRPNVKVLDNVTLSFPQGKQSALVGPSGGGKSSIVALLMRFYGMREQKCGSSNY